MEPFSLASLRAARAELRAGLTRRRSLRRCDATSEALLRCLCASDASVDALAEADAEPAVGEEDAAAAELRALVAATLLADAPFEPLDSAALHKRLSGGGGGERYSALGGAPALVRALLSLANDGAVELEEFTQRGEARVMVLFVDPTRLGAAQPASGAALLARPAGRGATPEPAVLARGRRRGRDESGGDGESLASLLEAPSVRERAARQEGAALLELLTKPTARESAARSAFKGGASLRQYCPRLTRAECARDARGAPPCGRLHFVRLLMPHTEVSLGDCSFLDTCRHMRTCRFVHYAIDPADAAREAREPPPAAPPLPSGAPAGAAPRAGVPDHLVACPAAQWLNVDVRSFDLPILGQFSIIMADPPWDIHMDLPYGTMADDEMRAMRVAPLQAEGLIFLWVTGRAMELGRECLALWGYRLVQELIWVKTNQLQRIIRTGRTGHWLNHSKEHCLIGAKGAGGWGANIDCDVIVAEVRETSRKPDEVYGILERLSPGTRKLEIFGREHNTRPGWVTLGNQLPGARLVDESLRRRFLQRYPERKEELAEGDAAAQAREQGAVGAG